MLKLYPLFSGSSGNMYLVCSEHANILIDIGVSYKQVCEALHQINYDISDITALFITHEHIDHTRGMATLLKKHNLPIFSTVKTLEYIKLNQLKTLKNLENFSFNSVTYEKTIQIEDITVTPFEVSHDAVMPVGYTLSSDNKAITIATDLGYVSDDIFSHLKASNLCVIEANYDKKLLQYGGYPFKLKERISSNIGHLSNSDTADVITKLAQYGNREFILGHISENNNEPNIAKFTVCDTLEHNGFNSADFKISLATRDFSNEVYLC